MYRDVFVTWRVLDTISMNFPTKNSLKPLELTVLTSIYHQVFIPIKKLSIEVKHWRIVLKANIKLFCLIEYSDFLVGMYRDVFGYLKSSRFKNHWNHLTLPISIYHQVFTTIKKRKWNYIYILAFIKQEALTSNISVPIKEII